MKRERAAAAVLVVVTVLVLVNAGRLGYRYYTENDSTPPSSLGRPTDSPTPDGKPSQPTNGGVTSSPTTSASASLNLPDHPRVVFLGDGFTSGEGGQARLGYAARVARFLGWSATIVPGGEGSGFVTAGDSGTLGERLTSARVRKQVDLVVVAGGTLDAAATDTTATSGLDSFRSAATGVLERVGTDYPDAQILVIGPFASVKTPIQRLAYVNSTLEQAASAVGAPYLSPALLVWLGPRPQLYFDNNGRLTADGQARVALQLERAVADLTGDDRGSTP